MTNSDHIRAWLRARLAQMFSIDADALRDDITLARYGLQSGQAAALVTELSAWLDRKLSPVLLWEYPTIASLAGALSGERPAQAPVPASAAAMSASRVIGDDDAIAVVGMACRFPHAPNLASFWRLLIQGIHAVRQIDDRRWPVATWHDQDPRTPGRAHTRWAGLLDEDELARFDPLFFGISPREAEDIDPQQRLFLELCWEALRDAGLRPPELEGTRTGVFAGTIWTDYGQLLGRNPGALSLHSATGKASNMVANRVSYVLGLRGPSMVVDTACSSSLVAVHLACQSIRAGDADAAIAGGVNLLIDPVTMVGLAKFGGLATDSRCKVFDAGADGFVRGEGGGAVVLKSLSCALAQGDRVYAVIRGSAINNDGASNGLTAPSPAAQEQVLSAAYRHTGVAPVEVDYVEAHGTGTSLGDPIEAKALGAVLGGPARPADRPLRVGSVKTNIGHLEAAAGIAGFIKTALSLDHGWLPPSLHFERPNPHIPFDELRVQVQTTLEPWTATTPRRAGVSAFGWGGTNCHVVLESAPPLTATAQWRLAAGSQAELDERVRALAAESGLPRRDGGAGDHRLVVTCNPAELDEVLAARLDGKARPELSAGTAVAQPRLAFVCAPQGGQWRGMARGLLRQVPVFRTTIEELDAAYASHAPAPDQRWSLIAALTRDDADWAWQRVHTIQPMILAVQLGLAALWRSWGVLPDLLIGHSLGEIAAAHLCGAIDLDDTARLAIHYSALQATTDLRGTMAIVGLDPETARRRIDAIDRDGDGSVVIAGYNSPRSIVLSGMREELEPLVASLQADGVFARFIEVNVAAHSRCIDPIMAELERRLETMVARPEHTEMISTLTGAPIRGVELGADYWPRNLRQPVRFTNAIELALDTGTTALVELGPHPILAPAVEQTVRTRGGSAEVLASTLRGADELRIMLEQLGRLHAGGHHPDRRRVFAAVGQAGATARIDDPALCARPPGVAIPVTARSRGGLEAQLAVIRDALPQRPEELPAFAARAARLDCGFEYRTVLVATGLDDLREQLDQAITGESNQLAVTQVDPRRHHRVVFVCPGQGSQWSGMGRELVALPVFRQALSRIDRLAARYLERSLYDELFADDHDSRLGRIDVVQPLLFAIEVALGELWRSWGIEPSAVIGHSMGEIAAAHLAGALPLEHAVHVICTRSAVLRQRSGHGAMLAVELPVAEAEALLVGHEDQVAIAVNNSPSSVVFSGDPATLRKLHVKLEARGAFSRFVKVDVASHSPQMDPLLDDLRRSLTTVDSIAGRVPLYSTVSAQRCDGLGLDAEYWAANLRARVRFAETVKRLLDDGHDLFIELSPHPILLASIEQCIDAAGDESAGRGMGDRSARVLPSMLRQSSGITCMLTSAGQAFALGHALNWPAIMPEGHVRGATADMAWERKRFWSASAVANQGGAGWTAGEHSLLGTHIDNALEPAAHVWLLDLGQATLPWLSDHKVRGSTLVSAAVYIEMALAALARLGRTDAGVELREVRMNVPLELPERGTRTLQLAINADDSSGGRLGLYSRDRDGSGTWLPHLQASLSAPAASWSRVDRAELDARLAEVRDVDEFYADLRRRGLDLGPAFRSVTALRTGSTAGGTTEVLGRVELCDEALAGSDCFSLHPVLLDGALQVVYAVLPDDGRTWLSASIDALSLRLDGGIRPRALWSHAVVQVEGDDTPRATVTVCTDTGHVLACIRVLELHALEHTSEVEVADPGVPVGLATLRAVAPGEERRAAFEWMVREQLGRVLEIPADHIDARRPLQAMGMTSLMTVELRSQLGVLFGLRLPATLVWNYPTLEQLLSYLADGLPLPLDHGPEAPHHNGHAPGSDAAVQPPPGGAPAMETSPELAAAPDRATAGGLATAGLEAELMAELSAIDALLEAI
jgi:acyl transferase domain-containing protein